MENIQFLTRFLPLFPLYSNIRITTPIIIDGSNIGYAYERHKYFSARGIYLCIRHFFSLGFKVIKVFLPDFRLGEVGSETYKILSYLYQIGFIHYTPSRKINNIRQTCYVDRILLEYAVNCNGIVVSNDKFRDMYTENPKYKEVIEKRHIMIMFVDNEVIMPIDQYGPQRRDLYVQNILHS